MKIKKENIMSIVAKLMNERENDLSDLQKDYNSLYSLVQEKLPSILDDGAYTDNASVIRKINGILTENEIFTLIPELAERSLIAVWGEEKTIAYEFNTIIGRSGGIELNTNLPLLLLPMKEKPDVSLYAITYIDKLMPLSVWEYKCITREIYKEDIDIRKLIKGFVSYCKGYGCDQAFLILPEYVDKNNSLYDVLSKKINKHILLTDKNDKWKMQLPKLRSHDVDDICLFGSASEFDGINDMIKAKTIIYKKEMFKQICDKFNVPCVNFAISMDLNMVFSKIEAFYSRKKSELKNNITLFAEDSLNLLDGTVKNRIFEYRCNMIMQQEKLEKGYKSFNDIRDKIIGAAKKYENGISGMIENTLNDNVDAGNYISKLLITFHYHIDAGDRKSVV